MRTQLPGFSAALAVVALTVACQDSSTAPRNAAQTPSFAATSDTGGGGGGGGGTLQFHFVANGDNGFVNWYGYDANGFSYGNLSVGRGGTTTALQTYLNFFVERCDWFYNCTFQYGYGRIPNAGLSGSGRQALQLNTNTAANPNFYSYPGPGGPVVVDWKADGGYQVRSSGTSSYQYGGFFTQKTQGSSSYASAAVTGSVLGTAIGPYPYGSIGTNHNVTITIYR